MSDHANRGRMFVPQSPTQTDYTDYGWFGIRVSLALWTHANRDVRTIRQVQAPRPTLPASED